MRLLVAILICLLCCLAWAMWRPRIAPDLLEVGTRAPAARDEADAVLTAPDLAAPASEPSPSMRSEATDPGARAAAIVVQPTIAGRARVTGRVVDDQHAPISGQTVRLAVTAEVLYPDGTSLTAPGAKPARQKKSTDASGRFAFEIDLPGAHWAVLKVEDSTWYGALQREFACPPRANLTAVILGENDLGDLVVATSGAIQGRVVTKRGEPIRGATIDWSSAKDAKARGGTSTNHDGKFELARVPVGTARLDVHLGGFVEVRDHVTQIERAATRSCPTSCSTTVLA